MGRASTSPDMTDRLLAIVRRAESNGLLVLVCPAEEQDSWVALTGPLWKLILSLLTPLLHELPHSDPSWLIHHSVRESLSEPCIGS